MLASPLSEGYMRESTYQAGRRAHAAQSACSGEIQGEPDKAEDQSKEQSTRYYSCIT
ncbi:MAG TPA: hypothetical protein VKV31_01855 [bacterium]|nr:hypothetical protein [bacterium]